MEEVTLFLGGNEEAFGSVDNKRSKCHVRTSISRECNLKYLNEKRFLLMNEITEFPTDIAGNYGVWHNKERITSVIAEPFFPPLLSVNTYYKL